MISKFEMPLKNTVVSSLSIMMTCPVNVVAFSCVCPMVLQAFHPPPPPNSACASVRLFVLFVVRVSTSFLALCVLFRLKIPPSAHARACAFLH